jgi:hypothetical protein
LKQLIHPAGFIDYGELNKSNNITTNELVVLSSDVKSISGRVNVSTGSITITGVNTKFIVANTLGIVSNGDYVAVNSEIRIVNNIINNTSITVSSPFTYSANLQEMVIYTGSYNTLASNSFNELQDGQIDLVE